jgi:hypothetical protein
MCHSVWLKNDEVPPTYIIPEGEACLQCWHTVTNFSESEYSIDSYFPIQSTFGRALWNLTECMNNKWRGWMHQRLLSQTPAAAYRTICHVPWYNKWGRRSHNTCIYPCISILVYLCSICHSPWIMYNEWQGSYHQCLLCLRPPCRTKCHLSVWMLG